MAYVTNQEKLSSSVSRSILRAVREDPQLREVLGEVIRPQPEWWLNGDPWINGHVRFSPVSQYLSPKLSELMLCRCILD